MKKLFLYFFTPFLAAWFAIVPGTAFALIPLIPGVVPILTYFGATTALATALDYSLVLHAGILAIAFNRDSGAATSQTSGQLTVKINPKDPLSTPTGWVEPVAPSVSPTPPLSGGAPVISIVYPSNFTSLQDYCASNNGAGQYYNAGPEPTPTSPGGCTLLYGGTTYPGPYFSFNYSTSSVCPAGYSASGDNCNLTNPSVVMQPSNNNCQIMRVGNTYSVPSNDPDCATTSPTMSGAASGTGTISMTRPDGSVATVSINSDGTTTATESYPDIANSKTNILTTNYSSPNPSTGETRLTGVSTGSTPGVGILLGSGGDSGSKMVNYNLETTQTQIKTTLNDIKTGTGIVQPTQSTALETAMTALEGVADSITSTSTGESPVGPVSLFNPFVPAACTAPSWTFRGHEVSYNICPHVGTIQTILGAALYVLTGGILFGMFTRRPTGGD